MTDDYSEPLLPPPEEAQPSLRQRKKDHMRLSYQADEQKPEELTEAHASVFLNMYLRKMRRRVSGKQSDKSLCCEFVVVIVLCLIIIVMGWDDNSDPQNEWNNTDTYGLVIFLFWIIFTLCVFFIFADSPYAKMLRYMVIYIPLLFFITSLAFFKETRTLSKEMIFGVENDYWVLTVAIILEVVTFIGFMTYFKLGPMFLKSKWLRKNPETAANLWNVGLVQDWTMSYKGHNPNNGQARCQLDYTCKYEGDVDPDTGMPDGLGRWLDDACEGEMLTGYWNQGEPVAPFSSWIVGNDACMVAVRVAYFKATDDVFSWNKFYPTNDQNPPEVGVASVECSVSGSFYKHLPNATLIEGPYITDSMPNQQTNPIREVLSHLFYAGEAANESNHSNTINIQATDPRGVQVLGHVYEPTGRLYSPSVKTITVEVEWGSKPQGACAFQRPDKKGRRVSARCLQKTLFMPNTATNLSDLVQVEVDDSIPADSGDNLDELEQQAHPLEHAAESQEEMEGTHQTKTATLRVQNWVPLLYKEAVIFCPGYNSCMEASLKNFGQFLAMTKLSTNFYPFVFVWPGSSNLGYFEASKISATDINQQNMLKLVKGLGECGIRRVHFMTHSMGVQTLLGAFGDKYDEHGKRIGRSDVSLCFALDPEFDDTHDIQGKRQRFSNQMVCKTITLLNPDFPVEAFIDRGFLSIRRVCSTVTVVGDRNDRALYWSGIFNGTATRFGYQQPEVLNPTIHPYKPTKWARMERIGHSIGKLYFDPTVGQKHCNDGNEQAFRRQLFDKRAPLDFSGETKKSKKNKKTRNRLWLDMDVIDMTGLDTNIKGMRHSGFSLNGMLLKDLEELLSSGKRAMERSALLFREGNTFSYAHAPAFVSQ